MVRLLLAAALFATSSLAWTMQTGSLSGKVIDPDGKVVVGLETDVILIPSAAGAPTTGRLQPDGGYSVQSIVPGTYTLDLVLPSRLHDRYSRENVQVAAGQSLALDLHVSWGMNLGTVGDDPLTQGADLRARTKNVDGPVKRLHDGRPDLSGVWTNISDGSPPPTMPMQPWAQAMADELAKLKQDNAGAYCLPQVAVPTLMSYPTRFVPVLYGWTRSSRSG
jgi:hypothetical protein